MTQPASNMNQGGAGFYVNTGNGNGNGSSTDKNPLGSVAQVEAKKNVPEAALLVPGKSLEQRIPANCPESPASGKAADAVELKIIDRSEWIDNDTICSVFKQKGFKVREVELICFGMDRYQENIKIIGRIADDYFYLSVHVEVDPEGMGPDTFKTTSKHADNVEGLLKKLDKDDLNINFVKGSKNRREVIAHLLKLWGEYSR
ncbi:hypothetical protein [Endozoicomonas sp.]|uniref:hypothetical protein n=1 Tax=Endozoicomonas sp. TaxID=1892382 RepID=UPI002887777E|nr:hypothetical protein [Endozoicomonas sp.]